MLVFRKKLKTCLTVALTALLGAATAVGCGSDDAGSPGQTTITFWDNNGGVRTPIYDELIKRFEAANPDINVDYVGIPIAQVQQKYDTAIAGQGTPDVGGVATSYLANLVGQDALEPLDDRLASSALNGKLLDGFLESVRQTVPDNKLYLAPATANLDVVWYRTDFYQQAGVQEPKTWDDFFANVDKLTNTAARQYGYTIRGGAGSIFQILTEAYAYSGVDKFFDDAGKSTVNDQRNVELIEKIAALYKQRTPEADVNNGFPEMVAQFGSGAVAQMHHNLGSYGDNVKAFGKDKLGAYALPVGLSGKRTIVSNPVDGFAVFKASKNKDAAWKFVEFLVSAQSNSYWNDKAGQIPANRDVRSEPWLTDRAPVKMALEVIEDSNTVLVTPPYYLPQWNATTKAETEPLFQKVLLGQMSAKEFADTLAQKLTDAEAEWKKATG